MSTNIIGTLAVMNPASPETTAATMAASGQATFGKVLTASSSAVFHGAIRQGASTQRGFVTVSQRVTLATNATAAAPVSISLPSGSNLIDFIVDIEAPFDTAAGATAANVEASVAGGTTLVVIPVSASTRYAAVDMNAGNVTSFRNVTATIEAWVSIQGSPTAMSAGQGIITVVYAPGS